MSSIWNRHPRKHEPAGNRGRRLTAGSLALAMAGLLATGCSSTSKSSTEAAPAATAAPTTQAPTTQAATTTTIPAPVTATETEYKIELSKSTFTAGTYTFNVVNSGTFKHTLVFNGPGVADQKSDLVLPGQTGSVTVMLAPGTYDVYCGVPTHKGKGMDTQITVT